MRARIHDGRTAGVQVGDLQLVDGELSFMAGGAPQLWPLAEIEAEPLGDEVRLTRRGAPERLIVDAAAWRAATGRTRGGDRLRELRLLAGLVAMGVALVLFVFVGVPLLAGPLGRATPPAFEQRMGQSMDIQMRLLFPPCEGEAGQAALQAFGDRLGAGSDSPFPLRVQAVEAPMINAFALPGGAIMITDDLIAAVESPDELAAVIAHEAAHVEQRHVMQALWRSIGLGLVLDAVVGGGTGAGQQAVLLAGSAADMRYSRGAEREADARGQALLQAQGLSSEGMAPFFDRLAKREGGGPASETVAAFLSTHPLSRERAQASRARARPGAPAFTETAWAAIRAACDGAPERPWRQP